MGFHRGVEGKSGSQGIGSRRQTGRVTSRCRSIGDRPSNETEHASHKLSPCLARVKAGFVTLCTQPGRLGPGLIPSADALLSFRLGIHPRDRVPSSSVFSSRCLTLPFPPPPPASLSILLPGCHPDMRPSPPRRGPLRAVRGLSSTGLPPVLYTRIQIFLEHGIRRVGLCY